MSDQHDDIRDEHYKQIITKTDELKESQAEFYTSRDETAELRKRSERINNELIELISRGPDPQKRIPFSKADDWRPRDLSDLGLNDGVINKLEDGGIKNLGELQDFWRSGNYLSSIKGIGEESSASIADAFADYAERHPEVYQGELAE